MSAFLRYVIRTYIVAAIAATNVRIPAMLAVIDSGLSFCAVDAIREDGFCTAGGWRDKSESAWTWRLELNKQL